MDQKALPRQDFDRDLGLGSKVVDRRGGRFINRDGSFNVRRRGQSFFESLNVFHWLLTLSTGRFLLLVSLLYLVTNVAFASGYYLCGPDGFVGVEAQSPIDRFTQCFFFSVQTLATIGYGKISPNSFAVNVLVTAEALVGLLGVALAAGIAFARFSRPTANIIFSRHAVIAPYQGKTAFMFRIANARTNQLISVEVIVNLGRLEDASGKPKRAFYTLELERKRVTFFPLHWVVVHPIDENSPLYGWTKEQHAASDPEFTILLTATDETFSQIVHARSSYKPAEIAWGAKFVDMFLPSEDGVPSVDLRKIHYIESTPLPK